MPWTKPLSASRRRPPNGRRACTRSQSSSSKPCRGRVVANASSSSRWSACSSSSSSCSLIYGAPEKSRDFLGFSHALLLHRFPKGLERAVIEHLGRVLAAAEQLADLLEAEAGMTQRDGVALALGQLRHLQQQRPVLDA